MGVGIVTVRSECKVTVKAYQNSATNGTDITIDVDKGRHDPSVSAFSVSSTRTCLAQTRHHVACHRRVTV